MENTLVQYVTKQQAKVHRKYKTVLIEEVCSEIVSKKGTVTADLLLKEATAKNHPLHDSFDWDNNICGDKWRRAQATAMILSTRYIYCLKEQKSKKKAKNIFVESKKAVQVRRFLPSNDGTGFQNRDTILSNEESRKAIIERKLTVLRSWCCSVVDIEELQTIRQAILTAIS